MLAIDQKLTQRQLQVAAGDAAHTTVAEQHGLVGTAAQKSIIDADAITAVPWPSGETRKRRIKVVLPAPRKPVTTVTGMRAPRSRLSRRPNGPASREGKRS